MKICHRQHTPAKRRLRARPCGGGRGVAGHVLFLITALVPTSGVAGPVYWDYPQGIDFEELDLQGVALDHYGRLIPGLAVEVLLTGGPEIFWVAAPDGRDGLYAASGHGGQIWKLDTDGQSRLLVTLPEPEVFSLLPVGSDLFAGGGPNGLLYRCHSQSEAEVWVDLNESYIWAIARGDRNEIYLAAGSPATVYIVKERLQPQRLAVLPAANALDLAVTAEGQVLVATQGPGLIYQLDPSDPEKLVMLYETDQEEVRQFLSGSDDIWYALALSRQNGEEGGQGPRQENSELMTSEVGFTGKGRKESQVKSVLYRIGTDGVVTAHWSGESVLLSVAYTETWGWVGAGAQDEKSNRAALLMLEPPAGSRPVATWDAGDVLHLLPRRIKDGSEEIVACLAHPGQVLRLSNRPATAATAVSQPIDGGQPIHWGRLRWEGTLPEGAKLQWSVRGGARSLPDQTWNAWSETWSEQDHAVSLSPCRFLQWRVEFTGRKPGATVDAVTVSGYEPNGAPQIMQFELLSEGELTNGGMLSREENVTETFANGLKAEYSVTSKQSRRTSLLRAAPVRPLRTFTWLALDPNDDQLEFQLEYRRLDEQTWRSVGPASSELVGSWNTASVPDGKYVVRLTASDRPANGHAEALTCVRTTAPITVDHTPPEIRKFKVRRTESGFSLGFQAADAASPLAEAWFELPDGARERAAPIDGVCDSQEEHFALEVAYPRADVPAPAEPWRIRVEVADRLGNVTAEEGEAR